MMTISPEQLTTFWVDRNLFGIDVRFVQEVTRGMPLTPVPLAPSSIAGLLNLRGQIATAISLRKLFQISDSQEKKENQFVICRFESILVALVVDEIGDVVQVEGTLFEPMPQTIPTEIRNFCEGVFKLESCVLSLLSLQKIVEKVNKNKE